MGADYVVRVAQDSHEYQWENKGEGEWERVEKIPLDELRNPGRVRAEGDLEAWERAVLEVVTNEVDTGTAQIQRERKRKLN